MRPTTCAQMSLAAVVKHLLLQLPGVRRAPSFEAAISSHYFSLVILDFGDTAATDRQITADMRHAGGYYVMARAGRFTSGLRGTDEPGTRGGSCPSLSLRR